MTNENHNIKASESKNNVVELNENDLSKVAGGAAGASKMPDASETDHAVLKDIAERDSHVIDDGGIKHAADGTEMI